MRSSLPFVLLLALTASPEALRAQDEAERRKPQWRLTAGDEVHEGRISFVSRAEDRLWIQIVSRDAMNFGLVLTGAGADDLQVEDASFAVGRGQRCRLVVSDPPFMVDVDASAEGWLSGTFSGTLACPDYSALSIEGTFAIPDAEEGG